jgi:CYTH domain-containing protein
MGIEIERKFLVTNEDWKAAEPIYFCQGYLNRDKLRTVRVRIAGNSAMLTVKSLTTNASRAEFEYEVPFVDAKEMLEFCEQPLIEKNRRVITFAGMDWEVDEFLGINLGLVVAEIELESESQKFDKPEWVGEEVTADHRYFNSSLSKVPYTTW